MLWCLMCNREPDEDCEDCIFRNDWVKNIVPEDEDDQEDEDDGTIL